MIELVRRLDPGAMDRPRRLLPRDAARGSIASPRPPLGRRIPGREFQAADAFGTRLRAFAALVPREAHRRSCTRPSCTRISSACRARRWPACRSRIGNRREINPDKTPAQIAAQRAAYACAHTVVANSRAAAERLIARARARAQDRGRPERARLSSAFVAAPRARALRKVVVVANLRPRKGARRADRRGGHVLRRFPGRRVRDRRRRPERERSSRAPQRARRAPRVHLPRSPRRRGGAAGRGGYLRAAVAIRSVSERGARGDGGGPADRGVRASAACSSSMDDGRTGLLVPPGDAARARRIGSCALMADPRARGAARRRGRARAREARYSFDRMVAGVRSTCT